MISGESYLVDIPTGAIDALPDATASGAWKEYARSANGEIVTLETPASSSNRSLELGWHVSYVRGYWSWLPEAWLKPVPENYKRVCRCTWKGCQSQQGASNGSR